MKFGIKHLTFSILCLLAIQVFAQKDERTILALVAKAKYMVDSDSIGVLANKVLNSSEAIDFTDGIASGSLLLASNLINTERYDEALKATFLYEEAIFNSADNEKISTLFALRAKSYIYLHFFEQSKKCLLESQYYAQKIEDKNLKSSALAQIYSVSACQLQNNPKTASNFRLILDYRKKSFALYKELSKTGIIKHGMISGANAIGDLYAKMGKSDSANQYYFTALALSKTLNLDKFLVQTYAGLARVSYNQKNMDSTLSYLNNALIITNKTSKVNHTNEIYDLLSKIYLKKGDTIRSLNYLEKYIKTTDSISLSEKNALKASTDLILKQSESNYSSEQRKYVLIISITALLLIVLGVLLYRLNQTYLQTKSHLKHQLLARQEVSISIEEQLTETGKDETLQEIIKLAKSNDPSFLLKFIEAHPLFIDRLMHRSPGLTTSDILICAYLCLGFYTKEISRYTRSSIRAIESKKYRLRKKLEIPPVEDINLWMLNL